MMPGWFPQMIIFFSLNFTTGLFFWSKIFQVTRPSISMILIEMCKDVGVSENSGTPKSSILIGFSKFKPSILGYPYFWNYPNGCLEGVFPFEPDDGKLGGLLTFRCIILLIFRGVHKLKLFHLLIA